MAKVSFTAITGLITGRVGDRVFSFQQRTAYSKSHNANPTQPNTSRQQKVRTDFSNLLKAWSDLTPPQKELWQQFATSQIKPMSAHNAFAKLNLALLCACHSDLGCVYTPPHTPSTPRYPLGFSVYPTSNSVNCITWLKPLLNSNYITAYFRLHKSFCINFPCYGFCPTVGYRPSKRFILTVRSDAGQILHSHNWPTGTQLYYKLRSLDTWGRESPFTHEIRVCLS
jgi:hypothetical protein